MKVFVRLKRKRKFFWLFMTLVAALGASVYFVQSLRKPVPVASATFLSPAQFQSESTKLVDLMKKNGVQAAFDYVETEINNNPSFAKDCHPLLHQLGNAAYTYYGGYAQAIKYQNEICDSGYTHGVLESYLDGSVDITHALQTACNSTEQSFDQWQCYHGLGHGVMFATLESVQKSIGLCNNLPSSFSRSACINGVFMQHFVVTDHNGAIPKTNPTSLPDCKSQPTEYKGVCYHYASSAYLAINDGHYRAALGWCDSAEPSFISLCVEGVGSQAMKDNIHNVDVSKQVCRSAHGQYVNICISGAIGMYVIFYASLAPAQHLCETEYEDYRTVCTAAIAAQQKFLHL